MSNDLTQLEQWIGDLYSRLDTKNMSRVNRSVATHLRRSQSQRIAAQQNPDGSQYIPRSTRTRTKKGAIRRRKMFSRIRLAKHFINSSNANEVSIGFRGRNAMIATVHQFGETAESFGRMIRMPKRELLGLTEAEINELREIYLALLGK